MSGHDITITSANAANDAPTAAVELPASAGFGFYTSTIAGRLSGARPLPAATARG